MTDYSQAASGYTGVIISEAAAGFTGAEGYTGVVRDTIASGYTGSTATPSAPVAEAPAGTGDGGGVVFDEAEGALVPVTPSPPLEAPSGTGVRGSGSIEPGGLPIIDSPQSYEGVILDESGGEPTEIVFEESEVEAIVARPRGYDGVIVVEETEVDEGYTSVVPGPIGSGYPGVAAASPGYSDVIGSEESKIGIGPWENLLNHKPASDLTNYRIQDLNSADPKGKLNLDYYSVNIGKLPTVEGKTFQNGKELLNYMRQHLSEFTNGLADFEPYDEEKDGEKWRSADPKGAVIHIDMGTGFRNLWQEDGAVVVSETGESSFIFTTIDTPWGDWEHPVSGHREFGVEERPDGTYVFYTRGADRPTGILDRWIQNFIFEQADKLWRSVVNNATEFINLHEGTAEVSESVFHQVPWHEVAERQPKGGHDRPPSDRDVHRTPVFPLPSP